MGTFRKHNMASVTASITVTAQNAGIIAAQLVKATLVKPLEGFWADALTKVKSDERYLVVQNKYGRIEVYKAETIHTPEEIAVIQANTLWNGRAVNYSIPTIKSLGGGGCAKYIETEQGKYLCHDVWTLGEVPAEFTAHFAPFVNVVEFRSATLEESRAWARGEF